MAILKVYTAPDLILTKKSEVILEVNDKIKQLAHDMLETMYYENGIGLSAVQVGVLKRLITIDVTQKRDNKGNLLEPGEQFVMINPIIINHSTERKIYEEGCLSFPGEGVEIERPTKIQISYLNLEGEEKTLDAEGLFGICIQHEIDHLNGITISNYVSHLKKEMMIKRILKYKKRLKF